MSDAPERFWTWQCTDSPIYEKCGSGEWFTEGPALEQVAYVRADLVDAKDARIAELEAKLESAFDHMETMNQLWTWHHIHRNDEADFINIQKFLAKNGRNAQRCEF